MLELFLPAHDGQNIAFDKVLKPGSVKDTDELVNAQKLLVGWKRLDKFLAEWSTWTVAQDLGRCLEQAQCSLLGNNECE